MKFFKKKKRQKYGTVKSTAKRDPGKTLDSMRNTGTDFDPEDLKHGKEK
jgi:hypothetical protein